VTERDVGVPVPQWLGERDHGGAWAGGDDGPARDAARLRAIREAAPFAIVAVDPRDRVTLWSPGAERMFPWTEQELLGQPLPLPLEGSAEDFELVREALRSPRQLVGHEIVRRATDGTDLVTSISTVPSYDAEGELIETIAVIEDLTDQRRTEQTLLDSQERFHASVENVMGAFGIFTAIRGDTGQIVDFTVEFANAESSASSWVEGASEVGASLLGFLEGSERDTLFEEFCRVVETGAPLATGPIVREAREGHGESSRRAFKVRAAKLGDGFAAVWEDVTEHVATETELERRNTELTVVGELAELLQAVMSSDEVFELAASFGARLFDALSGGLFLGNESGSLVEAMASWGDDTWSEHVFAPDDCWALRRGRRHGGLNGDSAPRCPHIREGPAAFLCVPLVAQGQAIGLLHIVAADQTARGGRPSSAAEEALAVTFAKHIGLALTNLRLLETLRHQSIRDPLTSLFNRRYFEETLEREIKRAERNGLPLSLMMLDIDHFKSFNDTYGHAPGDALMRDLSAVLFRHTRGGDVACRMGGDEFLVLLPETSFEAALRRAQELREAVEGLEVAHIGVEVWITVTVGVATFPDHADAMSSLVSAADAAMYRAKRAGGNAVGEAVPQDVTAPEGTR
jgi:diguanylate cyclase (GGDEF)-like protein/PAS domain S-box-containing protein